MFVGTLAHRRKCNEISLCDSPEIQLKPEVSHSHSAFAKDLKKLRFFKSRVFRLPLTRQLFAASGKKGKLGGDGGSAAVAAAGRGEDHLKRRSSSPLPDSLPSPWLSHTLLGGWLSLLFVYIKRA